MEERQRNGETEKEEEGGSAGVWTAEPWTVSIALAYTPLWGPQEVPCSSGSTGGSSTFPALELWLVASWPVSWGRYWQVDLVPVWGAARSDEPSVVFWMQTIVWRTLEGSGVIQKLRSLASLNSGILKLINPLSRSSCGVVAVVCVQSSDAPGELCLVWEFCSL